MGGCRMGAPPNPGTAQHPQRGYGVGLWVPGGGKWVLCPTKRPLCPPPLLLSLCKTAFFWGGGGGHTAPRATPTLQISGAALQLCKPKAVGWGGRPPPKQQINSRGGRKGAVFPH